MSFTVMPFMLFSKEATGILSSYHKNVRWITSDLFFLYLRWDTDEPDVEDKKQALRKPPRCFNKSLREWKDGALQTSLNVASTNTGCC